TKYLANSFGLKSKNDRSLIPLLRKLGFLDVSGKPTPEYSKLKNPATAGVAIAQGVRQAYAPLYDANENAHELGPNELRGLVSQVSGAEESTARFISGTLNGLIKLADFPNGLHMEKEEENGNENPEEGIEQTEANKAVTTRPTQKRSEFSPDFKFNIEIHLPSNGTEETYLAIFNALRKSLG
ncbi:MAG: hypothetical protein JWN34_1409, partial [Bryobacterales bacterium]|nr:hypothetical protein [Bryobacterales bacterium]